MTEVLMNEIAEHPVSSRREVAEKAVKTVRRRSEIVPLALKTVFTTGEAAKVCKLSQQTIIRCFDNGLIKGFRVPGSRFRRIPREALFRFLKENKIPTDALELQQEENDQKPTPDALDYVI